MATVTNNRYNHLLVSFVVSENGFKSFGKSEEFTSSSGSVLKHLRLYLSDAEVTVVDTVSSVSTSVTLKEYAVILSHQGRGFFETQGAIQRLISIACLIIARLSHCTVQQALLGISLVVVNIFGEVRVVTFRDKVLLFNESAEVSRSIVLALR